MVDICQAGLPSGLVSPVFVICCAIHAILDQQFSDIVDDTMNMYEEILAKEEAYIQADTDAAKQLEGADTRV